MGIQLRTALFQHLDDLRFEPTAKRIRAFAGDPLADGQLIADSTRAALVWEPRRVVPAYAVPMDDLSGRLEPSTPPPIADGDDAIQGLSMPGGSDRPVLDPSIPFDVHTASGQSLDLLLSDADVVPGAGFRLDGADAEQLTDYVILDFDAFSWREEEELIGAHPRDPYHRIDVLRSSRHVRIELGGQVLAESSRPLILFETNLPARFYLPRDDVRVQLTPTTTQTRCAYKGQASYWSVRVGEHEVPDIAWGYPDPLHESEQIKDHVCFFDERVDVTVDGVRHDRPVTPWSARSAS